MSKRIAHTIDQRNKSRIKTSFDQRAIHVGKNCLASNGVVTGIQWVNPAAFAVPAPGTWGNLGFDVLRGAGRDDWNLSLFKSFVISESRGSRFEFRADAFNAWNHTQLGGSGQDGGFSYNFGSGNFGQYTSAFDPREFQFGAKLIF